jgi:outer membrane protein assembly factor BamB
MKELIVRYYRYIPLAVLVLGIFATGWWITSDPWPARLTVSLPGGDGFIRGKGPGAENIMIGEFFEQTSSSETAGSENWPGFRGGNTDNIYPGSMPLINNFSQGGNEILWSVRLGEGHAGPAIWNGLVYLLDYDEGKRADMLRCFSLETGEELWRRWYNVHIRRNHGMSRTVPAVTEDYILTIGPRGHVMCLERETGDMLWGIDLEKEWGTEIPLWYTGQCPLIDNGVAVIAPGGDALMIGVDCETGEILWETPNPRGWQMSHSSVIPYTFRGQKMYVYSAAGGALGVVAEGPGAGKVLWGGSGMEPQGYCSFARMYARWQDIPDCRVWRRQHGPAAAMRKTVSSGLK